MGYEALIIGLGGLLLSVLTYFAGVWRTEKRINNQASEKRIDNFIKAYVGRHPEHGNMFLRHFIPAGINDLQNDAEIKTAIERLQNRYGRNPLGDCNQRIEDIGYKRFFLHTVKSGMMLHSSRIDSLIKQLSDGE